MVHSTNALPATAAMIIAIQEPTLLVTAPLEPFPLKAEGVALELEEVPEDGEDSVEPGLTVLPAAALLGVESDPDLIDDGV